MDVGLPAFGSSIRTYPLVMKEVGKASSCQMLDFIRSLPVLVSTCETLDVDGNWWPWPESEEGGQLPKVLSDALHPFGTCMLKLNVVIVQEGS